MSSWLAPGELPLPLPIQVHDSRDTFLYPREQGGGHYTQAVLSSRQNRQWAGALEGLVGKCCCLFLKKRLCPAEGPPTERDVSCLAHLWPGRSQKDRKLAVEGPGLPSGLAARTACGSHSAEPGLTTGRRITSRGAGPEICVLPIPQLILTHSQNWRLLI